MDIDWSKAPEGATHLYRDCHGRLGSWWKVSRIKSGPPAFVHSPIDGEWVAVAHIPGDFMPIADSKPWTGEGLPPAGTVCEWHGPNSDGPNGWVYTESKVVAYTDDGLFVCMQAPSCWPVVQRIDNCEFRPIRTPEQIEAEEREHELNRMVATVSMLDKGWARKVCAGLYDAGYRKFEIVEGE